MKERPILFNAPMVRAILGGQKTVTRRPVSAKLTSQFDEPRGQADAGAGYPFIECHNGFHPASLFCPYGQPGDRLWVRETWSDVNLQGAPGIAYRADDDIRDLMEDESFLDERGAFNYDDPRAKPYPFACWSEDLISGTEGRWRPSIFMPRWVSRILLEITAIRVERLHDITEEQARAEGITDGGCNNCGNHEPCGCECPAPSAVDSFVHLWNSTGGDWDANPWVWVIEFKRVMP